MIDDITRLWTVNNRQRCIQGVLVFYIYDYGNVMVWGSGEDRASPHTAIHAPLGYRNPTPLFYDPPSPIYILTVDVLEMCKIKR
jgi:hypothetical protein